MKIQGSNYRAHIKLKNLNKALNRKQPQEQLTLKSNKQDQLKQYIKTYVKSQTKDLLQVYSKTISTFQDLQSSKSNTQSKQTSTNNLSKKETNQGIHQTIQNINMENQQQLIKSTKIVMKSPEKPSFDRFRWKSTEHKKKYNSFYPEVTLSKRQQRPLKLINKTPLPTISLLKNKSSDNKSPRKLSVGQINPWEYLVISDRPGMLDY